VPKPAARWGAFIRRRCLTVALCAATAGGALAAPGGDAVSDPAVAALLAKVPADSAVAAADLGRELAALGPSGVRTLAGLLTEPGTGDDTKARMALHGLALYVAGPGHAAERKTAVAALAAILEADARAAENQPETGLGPSAREFLIAQLQIVGDALCVAPLERFLANEQLCEPATRALLAIAERGEGAADVAAALRRALPGASGPNQITILDALGTLGDRESVPLLLGAILNEGATCRDAALFALARSGDQKVFQTLAFAVETESWSERSRALDLLLAYVARLCETTTPSEAAAFLSKVSEHWVGTAEPDAHVRCAVLSELVHVLGPEAAGDVLAAMADDDPEVRAAATRLALGLPGESFTDMLVQRVQDQSGAGRVEMVAVLGRRRDRSALSALLEACKDEDSTVRMAAIRAAADLGGIEAREALIAALETADAEQRQAAADALARIPDERLSHSLGMALGPASDQAKIALLGVLAGRPGTAPMPALFAMAREKDPGVRVAALKALEVSAPPEMASQLLALLLDAATDEERSAAVEAMAAVGKRSADSRETVAGVLRVLADAPEAAQGALLTVLSRLGGAEALAAVAKALHDDRPAIREAAVRALADWPDMEASDTLIALARDTTELTHHVLALRGYVRLLGLPSERPAADTLERYQAAMAAARRPEEKKLVLAGVGTVPDAAAVAVIEPYCADADLRAEALAAEVAVADAIAAAQWVPARAAVQKVLEFNPPEGTRERAEQVLARTETYFGHITDWEVSGPYLAQGKTGPTMLDVPMGPENAPSPGSAAPAVEWRLCPASNDPNLAWCVELHPTMPGNDRAAYLRTRVFSPIAQKLALEVGSDDSIKAWINGQVVIADNASRSISPAQDRAEVELREGWNELMLKVVNAAGGWAACARFRTLDGKEAEGVYASTKEP